jgi:MarR family 2-MHQ and catechol resistance regulon transcriptional repressor
MIRHDETSLLRDEYPDTPARRAVVSVVRGFGALHRQMSPHYARFGLKPAQYQMLMVLDRLREEKLTQRRLARELYVSFPNITVMLSRLEKTELVERTVNESDRREKFVRITGRGRALLKRIWKDHQAQLDRVTRGLNDAECLELAGLLSKLIGGLASPASDDGRGVETDKNRKERTTK